MPGHSFHDYMRAYSKDHQHPVNRATHLVGIPLIVASLPVLLASRKAGLAMFASGWALQFLGHYFEGKRPSFTRDWKYLAIGPVWIGLEWVEVLAGVKLYEPPAAPGGDANALGNEAHTATV